MNHTLTGTIRLHKAFQSKFVSEARDIIVYLPPGYNTETGRRYPVLYLHDGQNLFDAATAFAGNDWGLDEVAGELIGSSLIEPLIIVGVYNTGLSRIAEYTHVRDRRGQGGRARAYGRLLVDELKPFMDSEYRTLPDSANTGLGGSSLGGLVTLYLGLQHAHVFGKLIVMSPSVWWANRAILKDVRKLRGKSRQKIWLDIGTREGPDAETALHDVEMLNDALIGKGWTPGTDLTFFRDEGAEHNEKAWGGRMREALKFLFPPVRQS